MLYRRQSVSASLILLSLNHKIRVQIQYVTVLIFITCVKTQMLLFSRHKHACKFVILTRKSQTFNKLAILSQYSCQTFGMKARIVECHSTNLDASLIF